MKKFKNKKLILFDLDGVLIKSLKNMQMAWRNTNKKFNLNISFQNYKKHIGKPFKNILNILDINKKYHHLIEKEFKKHSLKNLDKIKFYPNVLEVLRYLKKEYKIGVLTSKDKYRTNKILTKLNIKFNLVQCPEKNLRGKPFPDLLLKIIKKLKIKKHECIYIGDTNYDLLACKGAGIDFIFAKYGYKIGIKNYKYSINKFKSLNKIF